MSENYIHIHMYTHHMCIFIAIALSKIEKKRFSFFEISRDRENRSKIFYTKSWEILYFQYMCMLSIFCFISTFSAGLFLCRLQRLEQLQTRRAFCD